MKKFVCSVCGYVHVGDEAPEFCPICKAPRDKFYEQTEETGYATEHVIGVGAADKIEKDVYEGLVAHFNGECCEVGMYLAMSRQADREGYPELLGEVVTNSTKKNLELRAAAEAGACEGKFEIAKRAKQLNYDAIHDTVHEMAKDEARHGAGFAGLLKRYF